jgi:hypothetical protein
MCCLCGYENGCYYDQPTQDAVRGQEMTIGSIQFAPKREEGDLDRLRKILKDYQEEKSFWADHLERARHFSEALRFLRRASSLLAGGWKDVVLQVEIDRFLEQFPTTEEAD